MLAPLLTLVVHTQEAAVARNLTTNLMVLAAAIITSGGNITNAKVWKILLTVSCETMVDTLDITWEQLLCGWDYLTGHWHNVQRSGTDFEQMFHWIGETVTLSLQLGLLWQQTAQNVNWDCYDSLCFTRV